MGSGRAGSGYRGMTEVTLASTHRLKVNLGVVIDEVGRGKDKPVRVNVLC